MIQLLTQHKLGVQNTSNKFAVSFIVSKAKALQLKLRYRHTHVDYVTPTPSSVNSGHIPLCCRVIELQIKGGTYSGSRSTALREIRFAW